MKNAATVARAGAYSRATGGPLGPVGFRRAQVFFCDPARFLERAP